MGFFAKLFGLEEQPKPVVDGAYLELVATHDYSKPPEFPYHPNAYKDGTIDHEKGICDCCGKEVDYIIPAPDIHPDAYIEALCPWCVASGAAAMRYNGITCELNPGCCADVPLELQENITLRTPPCWPRERWLTHCKDIMAYITEAFNMDELTPYLTPELKESLLLDVGIDDSGFDAFLKDLNDDKLSVYVFQCRHCGIYRACQAED